MKGPRCRRAALLAQNRSGPRYALGAYNFETPNTNLTVQVESPLAPAGSVKCEVYDYPGGYLKRTDGEQPPAAEAPATAQAEPTAAEKLDAILAAQPEETKARLEAAGFVDVETWLHEEPTPMEPGEPMETFLRTVILRDHLERVPEDDRDAFVRRVAERIPNSTVDYVRLNIVARLGSQPRHDVS